MHDIHAFLSAFFGSLIEIASTGHNFAHKPHPVHPFPAFGFNGTPLYSRYG